MVHVRNCVMGWLLVLGSMIMIAHAVEPQMGTTYDNHNDPLGLSNDEIRLREIQNKLFDIMGNSSSEVNNLSQLMSLLHTNDGKEMGRLLVQGFMLGIQQKDSGQLLGQFWLQLQGRLSPRLLASLTDYQDFFKGIDITTLPLIWEQLFKKDDLGNSLAALPLGQLVDLIQPTASRYGIDVRALMNSMMGQGDNNVRDLILSALNTTDFSSLMNQLLNTTTNAIQTSDTDRNSGHKNQEGDSIRKGQMDKTLRLFRPLVASLLKENEIDLDADAVLDVLSPLFNSDIVAQASPLISMLAGQGDAGGIIPLLAGLMGGGGRGGGGEQGFQPQQMLGLLGGLSGLMAGNEKNPMDLKSIMSLASMFMGKPSKKKNSKNKSKKNTKQREDDGLDLGSLMGMAGQLLGDNINMDTILDMATRGLKSGKEKTKSNGSPAKASTKKAKVAKQQTATPKAPNQNTKVEKENPKRSVKRSKNLIDIIEPILLSMKTDKKCNARIKDVVDMGKLFLKNKISTFGDLSQILPLLISSVASGDTLTASGLNVETLATSFRQAFAYADWNEFLVSLENRDFRQMLIHKIADNAAELVILLAKQETQEKLYDGIVPRIQNFMASYGLSGVTLDNFPERLAPMLGLLGKGWNLPFNPTTMLVPLKVYLKGLKSWTLSGLEEVKSLTTREVVERVKVVLEKDVCSAMLKVIKVTKDTSDPHCLPQRLCEVNSGLQEESLQQAVIRMTSLVAAYGPVLQTPDSKLLFATIQAISGTKESCKVAFPGDCRSYSQEEEEEGNLDNDSLSMNLSFDHQEL